MNGGAGSAQSQPSFPARTPASKRLRAERGVADDWPLVPTAGSTFTASVTRWAAPSPEPAESLRGRGAAVTVAAMGVEGG